MGSTGGLNMWGPQTIPMDETRTMKFDLSDPDSTYVCIAVARSNQEGAEDAFRAAWPVEYVDKVPPKAVSAGADLVVTTDGTKIEGTVTINYDKYLYRVTTAGKRLPLCRNNGTILDATGTGVGVNSPDAAYYGLNGLFDNNSQWYTLETVTTPPDRTTR